MRYAIGFFRRHDYKRIVAYAAGSTRNGVHLIRHAIFYAPERGAQFVVLGSSPKPAISAHFWHLKHHLNDHPTSTWSCTSAPSSRTSCSPTRTCS